MVRFYAYPPKQLEYPWILRNIYEKPQPTSQHEIVDIKIYEIMKTEDYQHPIEKLRLWETLQTDGWKVVPDCFDLLGEFGLDVDMDNIEYTKELHQKYYDPNDDQHLPVIQGYSKDIGSIIDYSKWFLKEFGEPSKIAVTGSVCRVNNKQYVRKVLTEIRRLFPRAWIHGFAPRLHHVPSLVGLIDSFDSSCWTFPRASGQPSCRNLEERIQYFRGLPESIRGIIMDETKSSGDFESILEDQTRLYYELMVKVE